jgi:DNA repair exonuclease SbcCD ATPase subunit
LHQNLDFLEEIVISNQIISPRSLSLLSDSLKENSNLQVLNLSGNTFMSDLSELVSGISSSSLKHLDLSRCQLTDLHSAQVQSLLKTSSFSGLSLEFNNFKSLNLFQALSENHFIEELSVSHNPLGLNEVLAIMDALVINKSLKVLAMQGFNNILYDKKLAEVLRRSFLIVLKYDLDIVEQKALKELEDTLMRHNRCLVSIESKGVDWDALTAKHPLFSIKQALKANLWLSQNEVLPSDLNDDIFLDVQDVILMKQELENTEQDQLIEEEEMIALEYDQIPQVLIKNQDLDSQKPLKILEIQEIPEKNLHLVTKIPGPLIIREKLSEYKKSLENNQNLAENMQNFQQILEKFETKFEKVLLKVTENIEKLEEKLESQQEDLESLKNTITSRLNKLAEQIELEVTSFTGKSKHFSSRLEEKMIQLEHKDDRKSILLKEIAEQYEITQETMKDLDHRIDELDHYLKTLPKPDSIHPKQSSTNPEILADFQDLQEKLSLNLSKTNTLEDQSRKNLSRVESLKQDLQSWQSDFSVNLAEIEAKVADISRFKPQFNTLQKETFSKITAIECKILEISDDSSLQDLNFKVASAENRLAALEEKLARGLNETAFTIKHRDQLIESRLAYLEQERLNIEELRSRLLMKSEESMRESFMSRDKSLDERIASLEKMTTSKKPCNLRN